MQNIINRENPQKLYIQLAYIFKSKIETEEWPVGSQIPTEEELCTLYNVSRATVRNAILELSREGFLLRKQGIGTFVAKKGAPDALTMITSITELVLEPVKYVSTSVLIQTITMPYDDLNVKLQITEDKHIIYIKRLRTVENKNILIQEHYIPFHVCPKLLEERIDDSSLFELLEKKYGFHINSIRNYFDITYLNSEESKFFEYPKGSPSLVLYQYFFSSGVPIMYARSVNRPNRLKFFLELEHKTL